MFTLGGLGTFNVAAPSFGPGLGSAGFGMKYFISDDLALRVLLGLNTVTEAPEEGNDRTETGFGLGVGMEYHFRPLYSTSPYIGGQIGFASKGTNNGGEGTAEVETSETDLAIAAIFGFDWFFTRGLAVGAEYSLGFSSNSGTETTGGQSGDLPATTTIGFGGAGNVHLVVYF
jgi:opacity protein-like surface antigen